MAKSKTDICNDALYYIASNEKIFNLKNDTTPEADACNRFYDKVLKLVLKGFSWPFATTQIQLQEKTPLRSQGSSAYPNINPPGIRAYRENPSDAEPDDVDDAVLNPVNGPPWGFSYKRPTDCLRPIRILSGYRVDTRETKVSFKEGWGFTKNSSGVKTNKPVIYTDRDGAWLEYVFFHEDVLYYPEDFVTALAYRLSVAIAPSIISGDKYKVIKTNMELYQRQMKKAEANAFYSRQDDPPIQSHLTRARRF